MGKPRARKATESSDSGAPKAKVARAPKFHLDLPVIPKLCGNVLACGQNDVGQLGLNSDDIPEKIRPALVAGIENVVDIKTGGMHSLCLTKSGVVWTFGCNDEGALGRDTTEEGSEAIPTAIELPGKVVKISAGDSHSACLLEDKRVFAWGSFRDSHGSMGLTLEGKKNSPAEVLPHIEATDISSGADHLVILTSTGSVYTIGCAEQGQLGRVSSRSSTGESRRGKTSMLQPGEIHTKKSNFKVSAIWTTTYATFLKEHNTDTIYAFGLNNYAQLGLQKKSNSTLIYSPTPTVFKNVKKISGGSHHVMVLTNDNKCSVIGRKEYGRLGLGDVQEDVETLTPIAALDGVKVIDIDCGDNNSFAVSEDGKVYVWGMGSSNQLGTGDDEDVLEPKLLVSAQVKDKKLLKVSGGGQHTLFVVHAEDTSNPEPERKRKKVEETDANSTEEPAANDPSPAKKRKGKAKKEGANKVEKTNGNHSDKPEPEAEPEAEPEVKENEEEPEKTQELEEEKTEAQESVQEPDSTEAPAQIQEKVEELKESASETGSTSSKGSKRGRKRKL